jgi:hypothetical protein
MSGQDLPGNEAEKAKALLAKTLSDPFAYHPETHVRDWFQFLVEQFPLWSFQPRAFAALHEKDRPVTYPLPLIIESILKDDLEDEGVATDGPQALDPLSAAVDRRRCAIAEEDAHDSAILNREDDWQVRLAPGYTRLRFAADLAHAEGDSNGREDFLSPYEDVGRELVRLIEAREAARGTQERQEAQKELDEFLDSIAVKVRKGRPAEGPSEEICKALVTEGRKLLTLCWDMLPAEISGTTKQVLAKEGVIGEDEIQLWATRLALPVLSRPEILALKVQHEEAANWKTALPRPTPRRLTIWILARRLRMKPVTLADKMLGSEAAEYFAGKPNPVDRFLP